MNFIQEGTPERSKNISTAHRNLSKLINVQAHICTILNFNLSPFTQSVYKFIILKKYYNIFNINLSISNYRTDAIS
jgi:hypothetical protein